MRQYPPVHSSIEARSAEVRWRDVVVDGRNAPYGVAGSGSPVVFLHGFGLTHRTYAGAVERLAATGVRVYAPALPGFAGTDALPPHRDGFGGYARWLDRFLDTVGVDGPVMLVGHSFGGGVGIASTHDLGARVSRLVLVNSVGGGAWAPGGPPRELRERPLWRWGASAAVDAVLARTPASAIASIAGDALRNAVRSPATLWRIGELARGADLRAEASRIAERGVPTTMVWSHGDTFIPRASFESLREALRDPHVHRVPGCHGWLIGDPDSFGRAMTTVLGLPIAPAA